LYIVLPFHGELKFLKCAVKAVAFRVCFGLKLRPFSGINTCA